MLTDKDLARLVRVVDGSPHQWAVFKQDLGKLPPETAYVALRVLGERLPFDIDPDAAIDDPADVAGFVIVGSALMVRATRIRGLDTADQVAEQNWHRYAACRERAEQLLRHAVAVQPDHGQTAAWLMATAVDSHEEAKAEAAGMLLAATQVPLSGYSKLLSANTEKWGGSHAAMWQVARDHAEVRPPWSAALIAKAHYEHWLYLYLMDERPEARHEAEAYFQDVAIRTELLALSSAIHAAPTDDPYEAVYAHDVMAAVLAEAKMRKAAAAHLRRVGRFGDPALLAGGPWIRRVLMPLMRGLPPW
jgi:hypothetical protein